MSLLDNIEKSQVDIQGMLGRRPDVVLLSQDEKPIDYLSDDRTHFRMYVQVRDVWRGKEELVLPTANKISEYLISVPCIEDVSTCVLTPVPMVFTWNDSLYEMLVASNPNQRTVFGNHMLIVSFRIVRVHTYYSLLKLLKVFSNIGPSRFSNTTPLVLRWLDGGFRRYIRIDETFLRMMGLKQKYNNIDFYASGFENTMDSLCAKLNIFKKDNEMYWHKIVFDKDEYAKAIEKYWGRISRITKYSSYEFRLDI